jgi:hypothetical protein
MLGCAVFLARCERVRNYPKSVDWWHGRYDAARPRPMALRVVVRIGREIGRAMGSALGFDASVTHCDDDTDFTLPLCTSPSTYDIQFRRMPALLYFLPRSFDIDEMKQDVRLFDAMYPVLLSLTQLQELLDDTTAVVGSEAYAAALVVYGYAKTSGRNTGLDGAVDDMSQRFARKAARTAAAPSTSALKAAQFSLLSLSLLLLTPALSKKVRAFGFKVAGFSF